MQDDNLPEDHPPKGKLPEDESSLFRDFVGEVEPVKVSARAPGGKSRAETPGMAERRKAATGRAERAGNYLAGFEYVAPVKPWDILSWKRDGVQHGVFKQLRQGKYTVDVSVDLHRLTVEQARNAVFEYVRESVAHDNRCGLISHGRGEHRDPPALLKSCVNHWLREMDEVLAFHSAQRHHGGVGASYVLFRKSERKRNENRERYGLRSSD